MILLPNFWKKSWMNGSVHRIMLLRGLIFRVTPAKDMNSSTNLQKRPSAIIFALGLVRSTHRVNCYDINIKYRWYIYHVIGNYMVKHSFFDTNEFSIGEQELKSWPKSCWSQVNCSPPDVPTKVFVHTKNIVVVLASLLRHESFRADQDLVWGPEVSTDEITKSLAEGMDDHGYLSDVCHGWAYVSMWISYAYGIYTIML